MTDLKRSWTDPEVETVATGVRRIPLPLTGDALRAVNVYAIADRRGVVLVDAGWDHPGSRSALDHGLANLGATIKDVHSLLITHVHRDHFGQATGIARASGAAVLLDRRERKSFQRMKRPPRPLRKRSMLGLARAGAQQLLAEAALHWPTVKAADVDEPTWMEDVRVLELADRRLEVIRTPGHTWGHVCFFDRDHGLLFAGDHVLPHITPSIGVETPQMRLSLGHFLNSLALVRELPVKHVLPAHGPVFADLLKRVDELARHHAVRLDAVRDAVEAGACTGFDVARGLLWTRHRRAFADLDLFNRMLAVRESVAHLDLLVARQLIRVGEGDDGIARYELPFREGRD